MTEHVTLTLIFGVWGNSWGPMNRVYPGLRLSSQNLPTLLPKCMLSVYATVIHLVTQCMCFLQLTWTGSTMMSSVTVALPGITPSTWEKSWSLPMWSSFHAASLCSAAEETVAVELSTGSPVHAIQGKLWKSITRYAVFRIFLLQCCTWSFSSYKSPVISRVLGNWATAVCAGFSLHRATSQGDNCKTVLKLNLQRQVPGEGVGPSWSKDSFF